MIRSIRTLVVLSFIAGSTAVATAGPPARPTLETYQGKWELDLLDTGTTYRACSLDIGPSSALFGGRWTGDLVWRWGSAGKIQQGGNEGFQLGPEGELLLFRGEWDGPLVLRRFGDSLQGKVKPKDAKDGAQLTVFGRLARGRTDVSGVWDLVGKDEQGERKAALTLRADPAGWLAADLKPEHGGEVFVDSAKVEGDTLSFAFSMPRGDGSSVRIEVRGEVHGDHFAGTATSSQGGRAAVPVTAQRRRLWGSSVSLLPQSGLAGWGPRDANLKLGWSCANGILTNGDHDQDIVSDARFQDFKAHLEFRIVEAGGNSGVYLRGRYEVQILDDHGKGTSPHGMGAVYSRIPQSKNASKPAGEWQTYDITLIGQYLTIVLNGETIADNVHLEGITGGALDAYESLPGPLMLQGDHGKIEFRNVVVTPAING